MRMKHKLHGFTHTDGVYDETFLRSQGWISDLESFDSEPIEVAEEVESTAPQTEPSAPRRGRPRKVA